ncbi:low molecular weight protein-tyrosine-phosphatase [Parahaliea mediterranea]|uniref:low molecular weight protein-tyrosine-phosphatase n=1 Tax=Parahaliea mediterranea TaxID=651086 RepID=UPI000E2F36A9|nr:low molecular weight protein-tyrosine-phosphatase [Parahaliea mediterranea]
MSHTTQPPVKVLFVCLGNICRSPTAHAVFEHCVAAQGLSERIQVDSCGTGDWHIGRAPDRRAIAAAATRGYQLQHLRARQVAPGDFDQFDYILAMDNSNLKDLQAMRPAGFTGHLGLFLAFGGDAEREVPDPYYGGDEGFDHVLDLIEAASGGLLAEIRGAHQR